MTSLFSIRYLYKFSQIMQRSISVNLTDLTVTTTYSGIHRLSFEALHPIFSLLHLSYIREVNHDFVLKPIGFRMKNSSNDYVCTNYQTVVKRTESKSLVIPREEIIKSGRCKRLLDDRKCDGKYKLSFLHNKDYLRCMKCSTYKSIRKFQKEYDRSN
jgi:hypothetical protein